MNMSIDQSIEKLSCKLNDIVINISYCDKMNFTNDREILQTEYRCVTEHRNDLIELKNMIEIGKQK